MHWVVSGFFVTWVCCERKKKTPLSNFSQEQWCVSICTLICICVVYCRKEATVSLIQQKTKISKIENLQMIFKNALLHLTETLRTLEYL